MRVPLDLAISRQVSLATLWHTDHGGPRMPLQKRVDRLALASLLGYAPTDTTCDVSFLAVGAGPARGVSIRIRSVVVFETKGGGSRAFAYVERTPLDRRFAWMHGAVHIVACDALPDQLSFVDCAPTTNASARSSGSGSVITARIRANQPRVEAVRPSPEPLCVPAASRRRHAS